MPTEQDDDDIFKKSKVNEVVEDLLKLRTEDPEAYAAHLSEINEIYTDLNSEIQGQSRRMEKIQESITETVDEIASLNSRGWNFSTIHRNLTERLQELCFELTSVREKYQEHSEYRRMSQLVFAGLDETPDKPKTKRVFIQESEPTSTLCPSSKNTPINQLELQSGLKELSELQQNLNKQRRELANLFDFGYEVKSEEVQKQERIIRKHEKAIDVFVDGMTKNFNIDEATLGAKLQEYKTISGSHTKDAKKILSEIRKETQDMGQVNTPSPKI